MPPFTREQEERIRELLREELADFLFSDRYVFQKSIEIFDGRNIQIALGVGTKIGTAAAQKLSVYGVVPVIQAGAISAPTGGATVDQPARDAINSIRTALINFGITA